MRWAAIAVLTPVLAGQECPAFIDRAQKAIDAKLFPAAVPTEAAPGDALSSGCGIARPWADAIPAGQRRGGRKVAAGRAWGGPQSRGPVRLGPHSMLMRLGSGKIDRGDSDQPKELQSLGQLGVLRSPSQDLTPCAALQGARPSPKTSPSRLGPCQSGGLLSAPERVRESVPTRCGSRATESRVGSQLPPRRWSGSKHELVCAGSSAPWNRSANDGSALPAGADLSQTGREA
jgi:hypothetical protein